MEDIRYRHVIDRLEHRWASRLQQDVKAWSRDRSRPAHARHVQTDGARAIPVIVKRAPAKTSAAAPSRARWSVHGVSEIFLQERLPDHGPPAAIDLPPRKHDYLQAGAGGGRPLASS